MIKNKLTNTPKEWLVFCLLNMLCCSFVITAKAQDELITDIPSRKSISLNGKWSYIVDPYETGFYDYRWEERKQNDREAYWSSDVPENKTDRKEHGYSSKYTLKVPGDWNSQDRQFLYYEGTVWYEKTFNAALPKEDEKTYLYFGAVNYRADVYLNGKKLGMHKGGFTPFDFQIPAGLLKSKGNYLVVKVDNKRAKDEVPTLNTDWWNYGGITRDVKLVTVPVSFIQDYSVHLKKGTTKELEVWVKSVGNKEPVTIEIPELHLLKTLPADSTVITIPVAKLQLWSPANPKLYLVNLKSNTDKLSDKIGFRDIEVKGKQLLLNGKPVFLRGICIHEEIPQEVRRAYSYNDALQLLGQAKQLNANMVRLAHYPHDETMTRVADSLGILVWSEIPVYWTIDFTSEDVLNKAKRQLSEMITRDRNRASIIIWSVGNETPVNEARTKFMSNLVKTAKEMDNSRLVSAALEVHNVNGVQTIDDPLGQYTDLVSVNEYLGWYGGLPSSCRTAKWDVKYNKPLFFSETGAEALGGFHGDSLTRWSEEFQEWYYKEQVQMMKRMPDNFVGLAPWILNDFRSPRRNNPVYQEGWNNKGLFDHKGKKKKAFYVLKGYYEEKEKESKQL
jgi:beta-glucuronidase